MTPRRCLRVTQVGTGCCVLIQMLKVVFGRCCGTRARCGKCLAPIRPNSRYDKIFIVVLFSFPGREQMVATSFQRSFGAPCTIPRRRIWWRWADFWPRCCPLCTTARPGWAGSRWCHRTPGCNAGKTQKQTSCGMLLFFFLPWQVSAAVTGRRGPN